MSNASWSSQSWLSCVRFLLPVDVLASWYSDASYVRRKHSFTHIFCYQTTVADSLSIPRLASMLCEIKTSSEIVAYAWIYVVSLVVSCYPEQYDYVSEKAKISLHNFVIWCPLLQFRLTIVNLPFFDSARVIFLLEGRTLLKFPCPSV